MASVSSLPVTEPGRPQSTVRPIDLVHLARQTLGDDALKIEVLRLFNQQIVLYFDRVRAAVDPHEISMGLHTLKGAAQGVGAFVLAETVRAAERDYTATQRLDEETLDDIAMAVNEVEAYVSALIETADAAEAMRQ
ncbi:Hpt domain-containing protein [Pelagibacterium sediminicola]|uniref:Hpt domain-containing protein n=1 Tax=Pelagibacterium sediminicola TaxID=2248761 RepID=UPI000E319CD0|nr:Hpt domain-containing protein [Pelagibacterium sediminicola]